MSVSFADRLGLDQALAIAQAVLAKGRELKCKPLTAAVLDSGGHFLALLRQDGSSNLRPQLAMGKTSGALALGVSSRDIAQMAEDRPQFVGALVAMTGSVVPAAGGLLITSPSGQVLGAVGVTGDTSDRDEACALHALQFVGQPGLGGTLP
jgi:uncharacterized protein GlcG (DUF336 family)